MSCPVIVVAAGSGTRCATRLPKQFMPWNNHPTVVAATTAALKKAPCVGLVVLVLPEHLPEGFCPPEGCLLVSGGPTRAHSVLQGLEALPQGQHPWVMVHDAARPSVAPNDIMKLWMHCNNDPVGGILTYPIPDTLKAKQPNPHTVAREEHVLALTPQMFRTDLLHHALAQALVQGQVPTDEAQAMEQAGHTYHLVTAEHYPKKITWIGDFV